MEFSSLPPYYSDMGLAQSPDLWASQWTLARSPLRPYSVDTITLAFSNPFTPPVIKANYFSTEHDKAHLDLGVQEELRGRESVGCVRELGAPAAGGQPHRRGGPGVLEGVGEYVLPPVWNGGDLAGEGQWSGGPGFEGARREGTESVRCECDSAYSCGAYMCAGYCDGREVCGHAEGRVHKYEG